MAYDEETAARVRKVLSGRRDVVEKKMMGGLSFMARRCHVLLGINTRVRGKFRLGVLLPT
jgi:hypothetical protein